MNAVKWSPWSPWVTLPRSWRRALGLSLGCALLIAGGLWFWHLVGALIVALTIVRWMRESRAERAAKGLSGLVDSREEGGFSDQNP